MKNVISAVLFCFSLYCCSSVIVKTNETDLDNLFNKINYHGKKYDSTIYLTSGEIYSANELLVSADSTQWVGEVSNQIKKVETSKIQKIIIKNPLKGILIGTGVGLILGGVVATVATIALHPFLSKNEGDLSIIGDVVNAMSIGSLVGASLGGYIAYDKSENVFILNKMNNEPYILKQVKSRD